MTKEGLKQKIQDLNLSINVQAIIFKLINDAPEANQALLDTIAEILEIQAKIEDVNVKIYEAEAKIYEEEMNKNKD